MRTFMIIAGGLVLLGVLALGARWLGGGAHPPVVNAAKVFLPLWLVVASLNLWVGVSRAGYSVAEELPIFVTIFAIPGLAAALVWWKFS